MLSVQRIAFYGLAIALMAGCGHKNTAPQQAQQITSPFNGHGPLLNFDDTATLSELNDEPFEFDKYGTIDFFGVKLAGPLETLLYALDSIPFVKVDIPDDIHFQPENDNDLIKRFSTLIHIDGFPFGMNIAYRKSDPDMVDEVIFITSNDDDLICHTIVDRLIWYYGLPDVNDFVEDIYAWYDMYDFHIRFRHLHSETGGWTFYFMR